MKLILILLLLISNSLYASSPVWLIEKDGSRLYLGGTIHLLRDSDFPLPAAFDSAYRESAILVFETDIGKSREPAFQASMAESMRQPAGVRLKDQLSPATYDMLDSHCRARNLELHRFDGFRAPLIALTLTLVELKMHGFGNFGVDQYYYNRASRQGKTTRGLESLEQQIEFLVNMGKGQEDLMIRQTLEETELLVTEFPQIVRGWRVGDMALMKSLMIDPMREEFEPVYQQLLVERNRNWLPQLEQLLQTPQTELVLVGSAHLMGEDGLLAMLKKAGYRVAQLD